MVALNKQVGATAIYREAENHRKNKLEVQPRMEPEPFRL